MLLRVCLALLFSLVLANLSAVRGAPPTEAKKETTAERPRVDQVGDPLPPGAIARLGSDRLLHDGWVAELALSHDGKKLASVAGQDILRVWDTPTGRLLWRGDREVRPYPSRLVFSRDGKFLAAGDKQEVVLWNAATGREVRRFTGHASHVVAVWIGPDSKSLRSVDLDGMVFWWNLPTGKAQRKLNVFAGKRAQDVEKLRWLSARFTFSSDGRYLSWYFGEIDEGEKTPADGVLRVWDLAREKQIHEQEVPLKNEAALAVSTDAKIQAKWQGGTIIISEVGTEKVLRRLDCPANEHVYRLFFSPDSQFLVSGHRRDDQFCLWQWATGKRILQTRMHVDWICFSGDSKVIAGAYNGVVYLWETTTGKEIPSVPRHREKVDALAFTRDGRNLLSLSAGALYSWNTATWKEARQVGPGSSERNIFQEGLSLEGDLLLTGETEKGPYQLRRLTTGKPLGRLAVKAREAHVCFPLPSPDGKLALIRRGASYDDLVPFLYDMATGKEIGRLDSSCADTFSPDSKFVAGLGEAQVIHVADTGTCKTRWRFPEYTFRDKKERPECPRLSFSPDGRYLAAVPARGWPESSPRGFRGKNGPICLWDLMTGQKVRTFKGIPKDASSIVFSPDGRTLAVGEGRAPPPPIGFGKAALLRDEDEQDGSREKEPAVTLWEVASGRQRGTVLGHPTGVLSLAYSPDGKLLATGGEDTTILIWDVWGTLDKAASDGGAWSAGKRAALWDDLAAEDASRAYRAVRSLVQAPAQGVALLRERLKPTPSVEAERLARLLHELSNERFAIRERAAHELEVLGEQVEAALVKALADRPSLEARRRIERVLEVIRTTLPPERLREVRAAEALEAIGTSEARRLLEELVRGAPEARLTREANASLDRLRKAPPRTLSR